MENFTAELHEWARFYKLKIAVLMSTYNGNLYLKQQIDSILNQNITSIDIYVRDDGSKDGTIELLKSYQNEGKIKSLILGSNVGYSKSFYEIINSVPEEYDFYAFSDQDDYWLFDKISSGIQRMLNNKSSLYVSSLIFVDKNLKSLYKKSFKNKLSFPSVFSRGSFAGCTMIFNYEVLSLIKSLSVFYFLSYDYLTLLFTLLNGKKVYYDNDSKILHRIHHSNATIRIESCFKKINKRIIEIQKIKNTRELLSKELLNLTTNNFSIENIQFIKLYRDYKFSLIKKFRFILNKDLSTNRFLIDILNRFLILFNKY